MRKNKFYGIGNKIMFQTIALVIGVSCSLSVLSYQKAKNNILKTTEETLIARTNDSSSAVEREFHYKTEQLNNIAKLPEVVSMDWSIQKPVLIEQEEKWNFDSLFVLDTNGYGYYPTKPEPLDQSKDEFFRIMKEKGSFITNIQILFFI